MTKPAAAATIARQLSNAPAMWENMIVRATRGLDGWNVRTQKWTTTTDAATVVTCTGLDRNKKINIIAGILESLGYGVTRNHAKPGAPLRLLVTTERPETPRESAAREAMLTLRQEHAADESADALTDLLAAGDPTVTEKKISFSEWLAAGTPRELPRLGQCTTPYTPAGERTVYGVYGYEPTGRGVYMRYEGTRAADGVFTGLALAGPGAAHLVSFIWCADALTDPTYDITWTAGHAPAAA